jgi:hypothetical protein
MPLYAPVSASGGGVYVRNPIWDPPTSGASADDDEWTSDTLSSGTWTVYGDDAPVTTVYTRAGAVDPLTSPSAGTYRSTFITGTSCVLFQPPLNKNVFVVKREAASLSGKHLWYGYVTRTGNNAASATSDSDVSMIIHGVSSGVPDQNNRYRVGALSNNTTYVSARVTAGSGSSTTGASVAGLGQLVIPGGMGCVLDHSTGAFSTFLYSREGSMVTGLTETGPALTGQFFYGFSIKSNSSVSITGTSVAGVFCLHFIRRIPWATGVWIARA